jgi:hypothetical protein
MVTVKQIGTLSDRIQEQKKLAGVSFIQHFAVRVSEHRRSFNHWTRKVIRQ